MQRKIIGKTLLRVQQNFGLGSGRPGDCYIPLLLQPDFWTTYPYYFNKNWNELNIEVISLNSMGKNKWRKVITFIGYLLYTQKGFIYINSCDSHKTLLMQ